MSVAVCGSNPAADPSIERVFHCSKIGVPFWSGG
jgi:hypothetical protein